MTSNIASDRILEAIEKEDFSSMNFAVEEEIRKTFKPEFINRIDSIVIFKPLTMDHVKRIVDIMIRRLEEVLKDKKITIELTEEAKEYLAERGYVPALGARPLKRVIEEELESMIADAILDGKIKEGERVLVDADEYGLIVKSEVKVDGE